MQGALEVYRRDQKSHHEQSIASDLTRGLLRKIFRDTVLESSKQVCIYLPLKIVFDTNSAICSAPFYATVYVRIEPGQVVGNALPW